MLPPELKGHAKFAIVRGKVCRFSRRFLPIAGYLTGRGIDLDAVNKVDL
jgi:hypothetical protein